MSKLNGFISHAFKDAVYEGGLEAFRRQIRALISDACADFGSERVNVDCELFFDATRYGEPLMPVLREKIRECDFLIADITQTDPTAPVNPNVMYELGFAMALKKRILIMRRKVATLPPSDIGDVLVGAYDSLDVISTVFRAQMVEILTEVLATASRDNTRIEPLVNKVWFPSDTRSISIVCAREREPSKFSDHHEANYVQIDKFEDRDALLELATFFARRYPQANVVRYLCEEMPPEVLNTDLVILGGPGCTAGEGNAVSRDLMALLHSKVTYPQTGDGLVWGDDPIRLTTFDQDDCVIEDWGSVLAAPNPHNEFARVVLLHGTNTYGTLGAALSLIDTPTAVSNHLKLSTQGCADRLTGSLNFEALIKVEVGSNRRPKPVKLDVIRPLDR